MSSGIKRPERRVMIGRNIILTMGAVYAYNITYGAPATKTFTQPTITRNANGAATLVPQIVVS